MSDDRGKESFDRIVGVWEIHIECGPMSKPTLDEMGPFRSEDERQGASEYIDQWSEADEKRGFDDLVARVAYVESLRSAAAENVALRARLTELEAENVRHRNANLVRAVMSADDGTYDLLVNDIINADDFDKVPWIIAENLRVRAGLTDRLAAALKAEKDVWASQGGVWSTEQRHETLDALAAYDDVAAAGTATGSEQHG